MVTIIAWWVLLRGRDAMVMAGASPSISEAGVFTLQWGIMMTAMMLPSAAPLILLYDRVRRGMSSAQNPVLPAAAFAAIYLVVWLLAGLPVYAASVGVARLAAESARFAAAQPYVLAGFVAAAGIYQLSSLKRVCLRYCESPLTFLMERWRTGYIASLRVALSHATYCVACCWALMGILVAVGSMSLPWVLVITVAVFAEKVLPRGDRTARVIGVALVLLAMAITVRPTIAGSPGPAAPHHAM
jgi:predicted metal-binding membrane protein